MSNNGWVLSKAVKIIELHTEVNFLWCPGWPHTRDLSASVSQMLVYITHLFFFF